MASRGVRGAPPGRDSRPEVVDARGPWSTVVQEMSVPHRRRPGVLGTMRGKHRPRPEPVLSVSSRTPEDGVGLLPRLTSLRFFAAAAVFVFHLDLWEVAPLPWDLASSGYVGVGLFFLLSGFVLAWGTRPGLPARTFYRRRFARVWPSHAVVLACAAVLPVVAVQRDLATAVPNLFLVQAWYVGDDGVVFGMNGVSWSLSCEAFFYATFPVAVLVVRRVPLVLGWLAAVAGLSCSLVLALEWPDLAFHLPLSRYGEFVLGLVAGVAVRNGWRPQVPGAVAAAALALGAAVSSVLPFPVPDVVLALPFLLLVLHLALRDLERRRGWLQHRALVFAGEASFAFYLVHELAIVNLRDHVPSRAVPAVLVITPVVLVAAVVLHLLVERPANRLLRDRPGSIALAAAADIDAARPGAHPGDPQDAGHRRTSNQSAGGNVAPMGDRLRLDGPREATAGPPVTADPVPPSAGPGRLTRRRLLQAGGVLVTYAALPSTSGPRSTFQGLGFSALGMKSLGS